MKHIETHTYHIEFCRETMGEHRLALFEELSLFRKEWSHADVSVGGNIVMIGYSGVASRNLAENAAKQFQMLVKRHSWWKEIE